MGKFIDLTGKRFGKLTVIERASNRVGKDNRSRVYWLCRCDCGNIKTIEASCLIQGHTKSCGCLQKEASSKANSKHRATDSRLYNVWCAMKRRCTNKNVPEYPRYGGRGISVCDDWKNSFDSFRTWALSTGYNEDAPRGMCTLDRIDNDGNYCPENCRWVTQQEQMNNVCYNHRITYNGETHTIAEWSRIRNIPYSKILNRINRYKYSPEKALSN